MIEQIDALLGFLKIYRRFRGGEWRLYAIMGARQWFRNTELGYGFQLLKIERYRVEEG